MAVKYKEYEPGVYTESDKLKELAEKADHWNKQQLQDFTFGEQDLSQDYLDTSNALKNLVKPTWEGYSKQGEWDSIYNQLANMKDFSYDVNGDALYQQYKDQYVTGGKMAMMDAMGQASSMTGGYGNSYAHSVGQQAYQGYLQQLNDKVPELYSLALSKYNSDKDNLYRMNDLHQNMFSNEYGMYRDTVSDYNTDRSYLSGRESELYGRDYSKKYDEITSLNSNIVNERTNANDVYNALKSTEWGQHMDNETLKQLAINVANDNLYKEEQARIANEELKLAQDKWDAEKSKNNSGDNGNDDNDGDGDTKPTYSTIYDDCNDYITSGASRSEISNYIRSAYKSGYITQAEFNKLKGIFVPSSSGGHYTY